MNEYAICGGCDRPIIVAASKDLKQSGQICDCVGARPVSFKSLDPPPALGRKGSASDPSKSGAQTVTLPYPPSANHFKVWRDGGMHLTQQAKAWKKEAERCCEGGNLWVTEEQVQVTLHIYRPRKSGDCDNSIKLCLDALTNWAYLDDEQVTEIHAYRHEDRQNPRVEVRIDML